MWQRVIKGSLKVKLKFGVPKDTCGEGLFKERPENLNYGKKPIVEECGSEDTMGTSRAEKKELTVARNTKGTVVGSRGGLSRGVTRSDARL